MRECLMRNLVVAEGCYLSIKIRMIELRIHHAAGASGSKTLRVRWREVIELE